MILDDHNHVQVHVQKILLDAVHHPELLTSLTLAQWDQFLPLARTAGILGRIATQLVAADLVDAVPEPVRWHLRAAATAAAADRHRTSWEIECLGRTFNGCGFPVVLLKGAAYVAVDLPPVEGRTSADVDLLVPRDRLAETESCLLADGWQPKELPPRDAAYFRRWLHEIPPLVHHYRKTELDVHHNILPRTDRLQIDPRLLLEAARPVTNTPFHVLAPADMVLHAAAHLFRNGDFTRGLRDLVDIDLLVRHFAADGKFWPSLVDRAERLRLSRPGWLALRYAERFFQTPIPAEYRDQLGRWEPTRPVRWMFDRFVPAALLPSRLDGDDVDRDRALWLMAHYPVPRIRTMLEPLFWLKRFPAHA